MGNTKSRRNKVEPRKINVPEGTLWYVVHEGAEYVVKSLDLAGRITAGDESGIVYRIKDKAGETITLLILLGREWKLAGSMVGKRDLGIYSPGSHPTEKAIQQAKKRLMSPFAKFMEEMVKELDDSGQAGQDGLESPAQE